MKSCASNRKGHPLAARIKRLMQKDDEVGRIASVTPILISRALELFLRKICTNVIDCAKSRNSRTISPSHLKAYVHSDSTMDFLKSTVKDAPDLSTVETSSGLPTAKRTRTPSIEGQTGVRTKGRGRGDWCPVRTSKRQCVPSTTPSADLSITGAPPLLTSSSSVTLPVIDDHSVQLNMSSSSSFAPKASSLPSSHTELSSLHLLEKHTDGGGGGGGAMVSLPAMTSAVRTHEVPVDPSTLPINLQKALSHTPAESKQSEAPCLVMPPVSVALSISDVELGMRPKEMDTSPLSMHDLSPTNQYIKNLEMAPNRLPPSELKAEEDNYDFSEDEMETEDKKKE